MTSLTRLLVALGALLGTFLLTAPAQGAEKVITITAEGVTLVDEGFV